MVYYFKARPEAGDYVIYMGLDKHENEDLIKYGLPEDIWFHVDKLSSAHVYLRMQKGQTMEGISAELLEDCAQLVKANSIQVKVGDFAMYSCLYSSVTNFHLLNCSLCEELITPSKWWNNFTLGASRDMALSRYRWAVETKTRYEPEKKNHQHQLRPGRGYT